MSIVVYVTDLETTANGGPEGNSPEAHWLNNRILYCGYVCNSRPIMFGDSSLVTDMLHDLNKGHHVTLVGHNLKFDLKYLVRDHPDFPWEKIDYICTMHREYRLTGHQEKFIGLEALCAKHGVPFKKGLDLAAILASGTKMEDIPQADLLTYLEADVDATRRVYRVQNRLIPTTTDEIFSNHTLPLAEMELNGLLLDTDETQDLMKQLVKDEARLRTQLFTLYDEHLEWDDGTAIVADDIKVNAPRTISYLLTGKPLCGLPKGKRAIKFKKNEVCLLANSTIAKLWPNLTPNHLGYPMPAAKLKELAKTSQLKYPKLLLKYRGIQKLLNTYIGPFLEIAKIQGTVHPTIHTSSTNTGRGSSAKPNGQNLPELARNCFVAEFDQFYDIDFKQLEVCALAAVSQDPQLIADIQNDVDVHYETGRRVMGWKSPADMTDQTRRVVKAVNFGLIYGGGARTLAREAGIEVKFAKDLIKAFYDRYPGVADWQKDFYKEVVTNMRPDGIEQGEQVYCSDVVLPISKRKFHFREKPSPMWLVKTTGRKFSFKPTETKNYPIQGFAGGDIVMDALVYLRVYLASCQNTKMRMTVHDSILIDTDMSQAWIRNVMTLVCTQVRDKYGLPFNLEFDIKSGTHWK